MPSFTLIRRGGGFRPAPGGERTYVQAKYKGLGPASFSDDFTDTILGDFRGKDVRALFRRVCRGEGLLDEPGIKLFGALPWVHCQRGFVASEPDAAAGCLLLD